MKNLNSRTKIYGIGRYFHNLPGVLDSIKLYKATNVFDINVINFSIGLECNTIRLQTTRRLRREKHKK